MFSKRAYHNPIEFDRWYLFLENSDRNFQGRLLMADAKFEKMQKKFEKSILLERMQPSKLRLMVKKIRW
jgi:hypothetical protein